MPERAGSCSCTLTVSDIDLEAARLEKLGVATGAQMGEQIRVFMVKDPDGNSIAFAQTPGATPTKDAVDRAQLTRGADDGAKPTDQDLAEQAIPGHGVPSQDPDATAQFGLSLEEAEREAKSALVGGGLVAGLATGAAVGAAVAGPVGILVGGTIWCCCRCRGQRCRRRVG